MANSSLNDVNNQSFVLPSPIGTAPSDNIIQCSNTLPTSAIPLPTGVNETKVDLTHCRLCNVSFNGPQMAIQHYAGKKHRKLISKNIQQEPVIQQVCSLCNKILPTEDQAKTHYKGKTHLKKLKRKRSFPGLYNVAHFGSMVRPEEQPADFQINNATNEKCVKDTLRSLYRSFKNSDTVQCESASVDQLINMKLTSELECDICMKKFNGNNPVKDHFHSKKHFQKVTNFKDKLYQAGLKELENILPFCKITFDTENSENHVNLTGHKSNNNDIELLGNLDDFPNQEQIIDMLNDLASDPNTPVKSDENNKSNYAEKNKNCENNGCEKNKNCENNGCEKNNHLEQIANDKKDEKDNPNDTNSIISSVKNRQNRKRRPNDENSTENFSKKKKENLKL